MLQFFLHDANFLFLASLAVFSAITILEIAVSVFGFSIISLDYDLDADVDLDSPGGVAEFLGLGRVPIGILLVVWTGLFSIIGYTTHFAILSYTGSESLSGSIWIYTAPAVLLITLLFSRQVAKFMLSYMPRDETYIVKLTDLIGHTGTIDIGRATNESQTTASVLDIYGNLHRVQIRMKDEDATAVADDHVMLISYDEEEHVFFVNKL